MTLKVNNTTISTTDFQGDKSKYFDIELQRLFPSSSDNVLKRLVSCEDEENYLKYKAQQSIPYDLSTTNYVSVTQQPEDNTALFTNILNTNRCSPFNLSFNVSSDAISAGTRYLLEQPNLLQCKSQDNTLYFKIPAWENAWKKVDSSVLSNNNSVSLEAFNDGTPLVKNYYAYTNSNTYYIDTEEPVDTSYRKQLPLLNADGTIGGDTYACTASHENQYAYYAFDGDKTTNERCWWTSHGGTSVSNPCWITYYTPNKFSLGKVVIMNEVATPASPKTGVIQGSNDNSTWEDLAEIHVPNNNNGYETEIYIDKPNNYKYFRFYFTESWGSGGVSIQEITLYSIEYQVSIIYKKVNNEFNKLTPQPAFTAKVYGLQNATNNGCTDLGGGIYQGGSGKLIQTNFVPALSTADTWEISTKYTYGTGASYATIFGYGYTSGTSYQDCTAPYIGTEGSSNFRVFLPIGEQRWTVRNFDTGVSKTDTTWIKLKFTGTQYIFSYKKNENDSYTDVLITNNSTKIYCTSPIGFLNLVYSPTSYYSDGTIDMSQTSITIDGVTTNFYNTVTSITFNDTEYIRDTDHDDSEDIYVANQLQLKVNNATYTLVDNMDDMPIITTGTLVIREDLK